MFAAADEITKTNIIAKQSTRLLFVESPVPINVKTEKTDEDCATRIDNDGEAFDEAWVCCDPEVPCEVGKGGLSTQGWRRNNGKGQSKGFDGNGEDEVKEGKVGSWQSEASGATGA